MGRKKKLKDEKYFEILKNNSREKPFDIDNYDRQSILDCKLNNKGKHDDFS